MAIPLLWIKDDVIITMMRLKRIAFKQLPPGAFYNWMCLVHTVEIVTGDHCVTNCKTFEPTLAAT